MIDNYLAGALVGFIIIGGAAYLYITYSEKLFIKLGYKDPAKMGCLLYIAILILTILITGFIF